MPNKSNKSKKSAPKSKTSKASAPVENVDESAVVQDQPVEASNKTSSVQRDF